MRILWLSQNQGLYSSSDCISGSYNGGGWISSLQRLFFGDENYDIVLVFCTSQETSVKKTENFTYFPIRHMHSWMGKIKEYYGGFKFPNMTLYVKEVQELVATYKPDIVQIFGMENPMSNVLGKLDVPVVVHLQGLIIPYANAFWPEGFSKKDFQLRPSKREWLLRNGFVYDYNSIKARAGRERELFGRLTYAMGRTQWDKNVTGLFAPQAKYFHVNEVLRPVFYLHQGEWRLPIGGRYNIISVISETIYKGLDLVIKTAQLLTSLGVQFEWNIVGVKDTDRIVGMFESKLGIKSRDVHVHYKGVMSAEMICETALKSSLYVHPSYIDNSPNSLCEAQLLGVPIIATNVGGIASLLDGCETLQLVPSNGVCELAHSIIQLYNNPERASAIGQKEYVTAKSRHDRDDIKRTLIESYQTIISDYRNKK